MTRTRAAGAIATLILTVVGLAACGAGDTPRQPPATRPAVSGIDRGKAVASAGTTTPIAQAGMIASREGRIDDEPVTVELTQLRRRARVVNLELKLRPGG